MLAFHDLVDVNIISKVNKIRVCALIPPGAHYRVGECGRHQISNIL